MTDTWDGRPQNSERDGWHWLCRAEDSWAVCKWWSTEQGGWVDGITLSPATVVEYGVNYLGPCRTPAEVEAREAAARREGIEAAAQWHDKQAEDYYAWAQSNPEMCEVDPAAWEANRTYYEDHRSSAAAIRALLEDAPRAVAEAQPAARRPECVERWSDCADGDYDPRCCRFPKSCSCALLEDGQ